MKLSKVLFVSSLAIVLSFFPVTHAPAETWQEQMLQSLNSLRAQKSLSPLKMCPPLTRAAQNYAETMANKNFFSHTGKDGSTMDERIRKAGYDWKNSKVASAVAENIAAGQISVREVMVSWRNSKGHYKNMMNPKLLHVGFGRSTNSKSDYKTYWVQNFGVGASCSA